MFRKKRNALLEEMRDIARDEVYGVLEELGLAHHALTSFGAYGKKSHWVAEPAVDHAARAMAQAAADVATRAQVEPCGCRRNSANDTRQIAGMATHTAGPSVTARVPAGADASACNVLANACCALLLSEGEFLAAVDGHNHLGPVIRGLEPSFPKCERELCFHDGEDFQHVRESVVSVLELFVESYHPISISDGGVIRVPKLHKLVGHGREGLGGVCHCSSPVVADSGAGTPDAPAMTVQEGGSSDAAPGVEGVSPVPSTPRFIAVGEYVYDRERSLVAGGWPAAVATKWARDLNADANVAGYMEWEDAK